MASSSRRNLSPTRLVWRSGRSCSRMPATPLRTRYPVAIETPRGLLVAALRASGRPVFAINPMAAARYREHHSMARAKSDHADAMTLGNLLHVDAHMHRRLPADSERARAIAVLARAQQDAVWRHTKASNRLRSCCVSTTPPSSMSSLANLPPTSPNPKRALSWQSLPHLPTSPSSPRPASWPRYTEQAASAASTRSPPNPRRVAATPAATVATRREGDGLPNPCATGHPRHRLNWRR